jgi:hypothetical protein
VLHLLVEHSNIKNDIKSINNFFILYHVQINENYKKIKKPIN